MSVAEGRHLRLPLAASTQPVTRPSDKRVPRGSTPRGRTGRWPNGDGAWPISRRYAGSTPARPTPRWCNGKHHRLLPGRVRARILGGAPSVAGAMEARQPSKLTGPSSNLGRRTASWSNGRIAGSQPAGRDSTPLGATCRVPRSLGNPSPAGRKAGHLPPSSNG